MVEIFVQPLVGALCLIVFHIQAVMDSPDHCAWQLGLQAVSCQNSSQRKFFDLLGTHICILLLYYHCNVGLEPRPICDVGLESRPIFFRFPILFIHILFQLHCHYPLRAGCLFHFKKEWRIFTPARASAPSNSPVTTLQFVRETVDRVYPLIPPTPTAPQMPATGAFDCSTGRTGQPSDSKGSGGQCPPA